MKPTDLPLLNSVSPPTVHPDGSRAVVPVTRPDIAANAYVGQLWSVSLAPSYPHTDLTPRRLTRGFRDTAPQFSPDGSLLGFIRSQPESPGQLFVVASAGGEPVQVTDSKLGVSHFRWSPDGTHFAFVSRVAEPGRYGTVDGLSAAAEAPRRITTQRYRANGLGYSNDRRSHVFLTEVPDVTGEPVIQPAPTAAGVPDPVPQTAEATQITHGDFDHGSISFSPDGRTLAVESARHETRDEDLRSSVVLIDLANLVRVNDVTGNDVTSEHGDWSVNEVEFAADGALFFIAQDVGPDGRDFVARNAALYVMNEPAVNEAVKNDAATDVAEVDVAGSTPRQLTDAETIDLGEIGSTITPLGSGDVLVQNRTRGTAQLMKVARDGSVENITQGGVEVIGVAIADATIVVAYADALTVGDIAVLRDGHLEPITDNSSTLRETGILAPQEFEITGRDGYPIHGWAVVPEGEGPHPVLLNVHGGPFAQYSVHIFDEAQVYANAGYAVLMCNPRGSSGYGQAHGRAIRQAMGTVDLDDVLDFLDGVLAAVTALDAERVGIMGGSYGGYLTAWTIAHEHRFAAAIVERGFLDPEAFVGTSDIGSFFGDEYTGTDPELMRTQSPQAVVQHVRTPTLILHSEDDLRCPLSQAERYYAALRRGGVDVELVIFPGENHELSRSGSPRHRVERLEVILDWWQRYLPVP